MKMTKLNALLAAGFFALVPVTLTSCGGSSSGGVVAPSTSLNTLNGHVFVESYAADGVDMSSTRTWTFGLSTVTLQGSETYDGKSDTWTEYGTYTTPVVSNDTATVKVAFTDYGEASYWTITYKFVDEKITLVSASVKYSGVTEDGTPYESPELDRTSSCEFTR